MYIQYICIATARYRHKRADPLLSRLETALKRCPESRALPAVSHFTQKKHLKALFYSSMPSSSMGGGSGGAATAAAGGLAAKGRQVTSDMPKSDGTAWNRLQK